MPQSRIIIDRLTNKYLRVTWLPDDFGINQKLVYQYSYEGKTTTHIGINIPHQSIEAERTGMFVRPLEGDEKALFDEKHKLAKTRYPTFKETFKSRFSDAIPVTAKYDIFERRPYFYFYSEERYTFNEYLGELRSKIGTAFFLYQVGARDMVRHSPATDNIPGCNGHSLCCKGTHQLPTIDMETLVLQQLEGRDVEKLKGRCGKLKCSLLFEADLYKKETARYPKKGDTVQTDCGTCGVCASYNIMTEDVVVKTKDGEVFNYNLSQIVK